MSLSAMFLMFFDSCEDVLAAAREPADLANLFVPCCICRVYNRCDLLKYNNVYVSIFIRIHVRKVNVVWCINKNLERRLHNVQKTAARLILNIRKYDSISPHLINLHWPPIFQRNTFKVMILMYKAYHKQAPGYITDMLKLRSQQRHRRSSSSCSLFVVPSTRYSTFAERSFSVYGPNVE